MSNFNWVTKARCGRAGINSVLGASVIEDGKRIRISIYANGMREFDMNVGEFIAVGFSDDGSKMAVMPNVDAGNGAHKLYSSSKLKDNGDDPKRTSYVSVIRPKNVIDFGSIQVTEDEISRGPNGEIIVNMPTAVSLASAAA